MQNEPENPSACRASKLDVLALAAALDQHGLQARQALLVIGDNRLHLYLAMFAAIALRAWPTPIYSDVPPHELQQYSQLGEPNVAIAEDQEQVDKLLLLREHTGGRPQRIIYDDPRGLYDYREPGLQPLDALLRAGRARLQQEPGLIALAFIGGAILFYNTAIGVRMRAVSDDQIASWAVGIKVESLIAVAWGIAGAAAGAAGILWGSVQGVDWTLSLLLLKALAIAILGGLDSVPGVLVAGLIVGIAESVAAGVLDPIVGGGTRDVVASVIILPTVMIRPYGLFGYHHIERG